MSTTAIGPVEAIAYILATLKADAQAATSGVKLSGYVTQIFRDKAPQAAINNPPYILARAQGGSDVMGSFADRLMYSGLFQVCVYGPDTMYANLFAAYRLMDKDLHRTSGTALGMNIIACYREQPLELSEVISGSDQMWTRVGGIYRCQVQ